MDQELLKKILLGIKTDPVKTIAEIRAKTKDTAKIDAYIKEYEDLDRSQRPDQIGAIQKDKNLANGSVSQMVKIYINHAQNIVQTLSAFVVGKPVTLIPSVENDLSNLFRQLWRVIRMDSKLLEVSIQKMYQTQVALQFYINPIEEGSMLNRVLVSIGLKKQNSEIKAKILDCKDGTMTPYFDASGDMILFMWEYETKLDSKTVKNVQIWDAVNYHYLNDAETGTLGYVGKIIPHGFDRIPVAYDSQKEPQWYPVKSPADRHEVAMSKLGDSNDYSGHPILVTEGTVTNLPTKQESGKHFNIEMTLDTNTGEWKPKGAVRFLETETAPESNRLELEKLEDLVAYGSGVPNLTLEKLKSLGNVAEKTVRLMFLGTDIKADLLRSPARTFIERCINILLSGITTTTNTALRKDLATLYYDIRFNSVLPTDITEKVDTAAAAVSAGIMSKKTAIGLIDVVDDVDEELQLIGEDTLQPDNPATA